MNTIITTNTIASYLNLNIAPYNNVIEIWCDLLLVLHGIRVYITCSVLRDYLYNTYISIHIEHTTIV